MAQAPMLLQNPRRATTWTTQRVLALLEQPFAELLFRAQSVHRENFDPSEMQLCTLLSVKTGGCPEDCAYCPQAARYDTGVQAAALLPLDEVLSAARRARENGATRFCMGAAWRELKDRDLDRICEMVSEVKALGLQTCCTLGMLQPEQARALKTSGLDYYNHNLDTDSTYYGQVITTREYGERLQTLEHVRHAGIAVCCGGIVGMGESRAQRAAFIAQLASLQPQPESVPINALVPVPGTPLADAPPLDALEFVRVVAAARIALPRAHVRLSAGRATMNEAVQALCFLAGANSIFFGERLLTSANAAVDADLGLLQALGMRTSAQRGAAGAVDIDLGG